MSGSRQFSKGQKFAAELVTGRTGEADHIYPYSRGGETTVENCQILDATTNKRKAAFVFEPRKWQEEYFDSWERRSEGVPFMLIAIPGSGKTMAALETARRWMEAGSDRRVIVVVPSDNLRTQWQQEALRFGLELQTKEFGTDFKHGFRGGVATYQLVGSQQMVFRKLCSVAPTMVIFDEIHHCGESTSFGNGIKAGFELAKEILCMSGTPWKTDGVAIPYVRYDGDGFALADYRYDYPDALTDDVVRWLVFDHAKGAITNDRTGDRLELSKDVSDEEAASRLRALLDADGDYVRQQVSDAHRKLMECRKSVPDAAAMAICIDQFHAMKIARVVKQVTGNDPSIILSDEQLENDTIERFRNSSKEWLVSVRKVSEGTDIKRLQVLCYLTNVTSELFFRQVIGRVSRVRDLEDYEGYIYLPADPRLIRCAQNIENAQVIALRQPPKSRDASDREGHSDLFESWTTEHTGTDTILIGHAHVPVVEAREIERIAEAVGVSMQKVMEVRNLVLSGRPAAPKQPTPVQEKGLEEKMQDLRKKCQKQAFILAKLLGCGPDAVHMQFKKQADMSLAELEEKYRWLTEERKRCSTR